MSSSIQNGQYSEPKWPFISHLIPAVAASTAIVPVFYGFIAKSALQLGEPIPKMTFMAASKQGIKASPTIGVIVGTQMVIQNIIEKALIKNSENKMPSFTNMLASSVVVGSFSAPALAVFNGQTMGRGVKESLKLITAKQMAAVVTRETSFLFSLRISGPVSEIMKQKCGDNKVIEYGSGFISGAIGSLGGHLPDTALTLWQKGRRVENMSQLCKGGAVKSMTVGAFTFFYMVVKDVLNAMN